ncbi:pyridoxal-phosphate dependent enzyme [Mangrovivirga sp. M17]|uniref:Pyridoxal-phosphate dependent enzyme n=1 Tax=Mangrovivirga halotolerans TaxID=2993936 RepID=A0ABT3RS89_9BACT|nr:pyridoxal-phosphate dependent enzyme [Mangrovivirga halotolerans]MCX2744653.1 pyridoxal-phosphate dependent enzyme [Mangrovivirga halotolerans]
MLAEIKKEDINKAAEKISPYVHNTPVFTSKFFNELSGAELFFKCENFQKVGAFKARGGVHAALNLSDAELKKGLVTHSSGNHAQAVAYAAKILGAKAYIVMPDNAPKVKVNAVKGYGAEVILCEPTLEARESTLEEVQKEKEAIFIPPFNHNDVILGQATCAKELIEEVNDLDIIIAPIGGGGLISGTILSAKVFGKGIKVYGGEPEGADDAYRSLKSGELVKSHTPDTVADGLLVTLGDKTWAIIKEGIADIILVNDEQILEAMKLVWERMKIIIEPSCAVPVAAILKEKDLFKDKRVGIILTGGNVDLSRNYFS